MNKIKLLNEIVDVIHELKQHNKLSWSQKFLNLFRKRPIENIVLNKEREKVLHRRVVRLKRRLNGK